MDTSKQSESIQDDQTNALQEKPVEEQVPVEAVTEKTLPKSVGVVKSVWKIFKDNFKILSPLFLVIGLSDFVNNVVSDEKISERIDTLSVSTQVLIYSSSFILMVIAVIFTFALFRAVIDLKKGQFEGVKSSLVFSIQNIWSYIVIMALVTLSTIGSFALLIVPGIILAIYLSFSVPAFLDENKKPFDSLLRSWALVRGDVWKIFSKMFSVGLIWMFFCLLLFIVLILITSIIGGVLSSMNMFGLVPEVLLTSLITVYLIAIMATPVSVITVVEIYFAQKAIKGDVVVGADLEKSRKMKIIGASVLAIIIPIIISIVLAVNN